MSEALNDIFIDNFQKDPTLTWQYFGSATGFFRLYPGILRDIFASCKFTLLLFLPAVFSPITVLLMQ